MLLSLTLLNDVGVICLFFLISWSMEWILMEFNNKTILITGLVVSGICCLFLNYQDIALAIVSGLLGYLAKDPYTIEKEVVIGDGSDIEDS